MHISEQVKKKKKRIALKVFLIFVLLIVLAISVFAYQQRENIKAVIDSQKYSEEELTEKIAESKEKSQKIIEEYEVPIVRDFSLEEEEKLRKGELTAEEAMQLIMPSDDSVQMQEGSENADSVENTADNKADTESENKEEQTVQEPTPKTIVAKYLPQVYSLKAEYISGLGEVESLMRAEYKAAGKDKSKVPEIVSAHLPQVSAMEGECDRKIASLLNSLRSELSAIGADTSIADEIYDAYVEEKALKKAYYLNKIDK